LQKAWKSGTLIEIVMRKVTIIVGLAALVAVVIVGWQVGSCELANIELQDDMWDIAAQTGSRIGLAQISSDEDLRSAVIRKAAQHDIKLKPEQVRVERSGSGETATVYLRADYRIQFNAPGWTYTLRFTPTSRR
jgi:cell division protein FtsL